MRRYVALGNVSTREVSGDVHFAGFGGECSCRVTVTVSCEPEVRTLGGETVSAPYEDIVDFEVDDFEFSGHDGFFLRLETEHINRIKWRNLSKLQKLVEPHLEQVF